MGVLTQFAPLPTMFCAQSCLFDFFSLCLIVFLFVCLFYFLVHLPFQMEAHLEKNSSVWLKFTMGVRAQSAPIAIACPCP